MTCKDCIHYNICLDNGDDAAKQNAPNAEKECDDFKNKVDFVEVVRCKDCKHSVKGEIWRVCKIYSTTHINRVVHSEHFCSYGERSNK